MTNTASHIRAIGRAMHSLLRKPLAWPVLGAVLTLPALFAGFFADDYLQMLRMENAQDAGAGPLSLYTFASGDPGETSRAIASGALPWWTWPGLRLSFFRPLSSVLLLADHGLFGRAALGYHIHSWVWYVAFLSVGCWAFRRTLTSNLALWASLVFCLDDAHSQAVGWIAARSGLVSCFLGLLGLLAHIRQREQGWRPGQLLSLLCFAGSLGAGETGVAMLAYVAAYEIIGARSPRVPHALAGLLAVYVCVYVVTGSGAAGSGAYVDFSSSPLAAVGALASRFPAALGALIVGVPLDLWVVKMRWRTGTTAIGLVAAIGVLIWARAAIRRPLSSGTRGMAWWGAGALLATLPSLAGLMGERLLIAPSLGGAVVIGAMLDGAFSRLRSPRPDRPLGTLAALGGALALIILHVAGPLLLRPAKLALLARIADRAADVVSTMPQGESARPRRVVLWAGDPFIGFYARAIRRLHLGDDALSWWTMSMSLSPQELTRPSSNTLVLRTLADAGLRHDWEVLFRSERHPLAPNDRVSLQDAEVVVRAVTGGWPSLVEWRFRGPLEGGEWQFLQWRGSQLVPFTLPAVGSSMIIDHERPLWSLGGVRSSKQKGQPGEEP